MMRQHPVSQGENRLPESLFALLPMAIECRVRSRGS